MTAKIHLRFVAVPMALALVLAPLSGCASSTPSASEPAFATPSEEAERAAPSASAAPTIAPAETGAATSDVCAVLSDDEVSGVIGLATVDANLSFGSLGDSTGGQCVWASTSTPGAYLELAAWPAGSLNPAPAEAPAPGSGGFVTTPGGAYFADATHSFRLAVTGVVDPALEAAAQALAQAVQARR